MSARLILLLCTINIALVLTQTKLTFLGEVDQTGVSQVDAIPPVVADTVNFAVGFNSGLSFFVSLPHQDQCQSGSQKLSDDLVALFKLVKSINKDTDFTKFVADLAAVLSDGYQQVTGLEQNCSEWSNEANNVFKGLVDYVSAADYVTKLTVHTLLSIKTIQTNIESGVKLIKDGNFLDAGSVFGVTARLALFWDFKN